jgi:hypothetical protein
MITQAATWRNPQILATLALVFLCGATAGALTMRFGLHDRLHRTAAGIDSRGGPSKEVLIAKFHKELDLSAEQELKISAVLDDFLSYVRDLQVQMDDVRANGKARIMDVLNDQQRQKFDRMLNDLQTGRPAASR